MSSTVTELFPIDDPKSFSKRLFFAKEELTANLIHICDAAMGQKIGQTIHYMALHGRPMRIAIQYDTVLQLKIAQPNGMMCMHCLDEFELAKETIKDRKMLKFS